MLTTTNLSVVTMIFSKDEQLSLSMNLNDSAYVSQVKWFSKQCM